MQRNKPATAAPEPRAPTAPAGMLRRPAMGPSGTFTFPAPRVRPLPGGARLLVVPKRDLPLVSLQVLIPAGTAADPVGRCGMAYLTAKMLGEGAGRRDALAFSAEVARLGATFSAWAEEDATHLSLLVLRRHLAPALDLLCDALLRPRLDAGELRRVKGEARARALQRRSQPEQVSSLALVAALFGSGHAYGRPLLPLPGQLDALSARQLRAFHKAHYRPEGALFVAAGDVGPAELAGLLGPRLQGWAGPRQAPPPAPRPSPAPRLVLVDRPGAAQAVIQVGHLVPPRRTPDRVGLRALNVILGGSFTSRLNRNLRERNGFTYGVGSAFELLALGGSLLIQTSVQTKDTAAALREILRELRRLRQRPVSAAELQKAQRQLVESLSGYAETVSALGASYADLALYGLPLNTLARLPERLASLRPADLLALARRRLQPDTATLVVVGDAAALRAPLEAAYGPAELRDADGLRTGR